MQNYVITSSPTERITSTCTMLQTKLTVKQPSVLVGFMIFYKFNVLFLYRLSAQNLMFLSTYEVILENFWSLSRQLIPLVLIIKLVATNKTSTQKQ